ncbi:MAG: hypothetical protein WAV45_03500 [Propionibacteriaceae bacterium]
MGSRAARPLLRGERGDTWQAWVVGLLCAGVGAALCALVAVSPMPWWVKVAILALGALMVPTAKHLSGRILLASTTLFGSSLVVWLLPLRLLGLSHGMFLALVVGFLAGGSLGWAWRRGNLAAMAPEVAWLDAVPLASIAASIVQLRRMLFVHDLPTALTMVIEHWDNSSHIYITRLLRETGQLQIFNGLAFDGTPWGFANYPSGYHATVASVMDIVTSPSGTDVLGEVLGFWHVVGLLLIVVAVGCVAAVTATPLARQRPWVGFVAGTWMLVLFLLGPALFPVGDGHQNIPVCFLGMCAVFSAMLGADRVWQPREVGLAVAGVVAAAGAWAPLGALAGVAAVAIALPFARDRWVGSRTTVATCVAMVTTGAVALAAIAKWATSGVSGEVLFTAKGGVKTLDGGLQYFVVGALGLAWLTTIAVAWSERRQSGPRARLVILGLAPLGALAIYLYSGHEQIRAIGELRYYVQKVGVSATIIALLFLVFCALYLAPPRERVLTSVGQRRWIGALLVALSLFAFGTPIMNPYFPDALAPGLGAFSPATLASEGDLLAAMLTASKDVPEDQHLVLLTPKLGPITGARYMVVLEAVRGTYTDGSSQLNNKSVLGTGSGDMIAVAAALVQANPHATILTDSESRGQILALVDASLAGRIVSYE